MVVIGRVLKPLSAEENEPEIPANATIEEKKKFAEEKKKAEKEKLTR